MKQYVSSRDGLIEVSDEASGGSCGSPAACAVIVAGTVPRVIPRAGVDGGFEKAVDAGVWGRLGIRRRLATISAITQALRLDAKKVGLDRGRPTDAPQERRKPQEAVGQGAGWVGSIRD